MSDRDRIELAAVWRVLTHYPADCQPVRVEALGWAGGMSGARFWQVETQRGPAMLRRWPAEHPPPERLTFIHAVLRHAAERGVPFLPVPWLTREGSSFVREAGHVWELAPRMPGAADYRASPSRAKLNAALVALAQFHAAVAGFSADRSAANDSTLTTAAGDACGLSPALRRRLELLTDLEAGEAEQLARCVDERVWPRLAPLAQRFLALLPPALPAAIAEVVPLAKVTFILQPCLRDIWHDHILYEGDEVTGTVDFGAMAVDTPAGDVGRLLGSLAEGDGGAWSAGLAAYETLRPLTGDERRAGAAFDRSGTILAGCNWIRWVYREGRHFDDPSQVIERFERIVARLLH